jgi:hypothetical protein
VAVVTAADTVVAAVAAIAVVTVVVTAVATIAEATVADTVVTSTRINRYPKGTLRAIGGFFRFRRAIPVGTAAGLMCGPLSEQM